MDKLAQPQAITVAHTRQKIKPLTQPEREKVVAKTAFLFIKSYAGPISTNMAACSKPDIHRQQQKQLRNMGFSEQNFSVIQQTCQLLYVRISRAMETGRADEWAAVGSSVENVIAAMGMFAFEVDASTSFIAKFIFILFPCFEESRVRKMMEYMARGKGGGQTPSIEPEMDRRKVETDRAGSPKKGCIVSRQNSVLSNNPKPVATENVSYLRNVAMWSAATPVKQHSTRPLPPMPKTAIIRPAPASPSGKKSIWTHIKEATQRILSSNDKRGENSKSGKTKTSKSSSTTSVSRSPAECQRFKVKAENHAEENRSRRSEKTKNPSSCRTVDIPEQSEPVVLRRHMEQSSQTEDRKVLQTSYIDSTYLEMHRVEIQCLSSWQDAENWLQAYDNMQTVTDDERIADCYGLPLIQPREKVQSYGAKAAVVLTKQAKSFADQLTNDDNSTVVSLHDWSSCPASEILNRALPAELENSRDQMCVTLTPRGMMCRLIIDKETVIDRHLLAPSAFCTLIEIVQVDEKHADSSVSLAVKLISIWTRVRFATDQKIAIEKFCADVPSMCMLIGKSLVEMGRTAQIIFLTVNPSNFLNITEFDGEDRAMSDSTGTSRGTQTKVLGSFTGRSILYLLVILRSHIIHCYNTVWSRDAVNVNRFPRITKLMLHSIYRIHSTKPWTLANPECTDAFQIVWSLMRNSFLDALILDSCENIGECPRWKAIVEILCREDCISVKAESNLAHTSVAKNRMFDMPALREDGFSQKRGGRDRLKVDKNRKQSNLVNEANKRLELDKESSMQPPDQVSDGKENEVKADLRLLDTANNERSSVDNDGGSYSAQQSTEQEVEFNVENSPSVKKRRKRKRSSAKRRFMVAPEFLKLENGENKTERDDKRDETEAGRAEDQSQAPGFDAVPSDKEDGTEPSREKSFTEPDEAEDNGKEKEDGIENERVEIHVEQPNPTTPNGDSLDDQLIRKLTPASCKKRAKTNPKSARSKSRLVMSLEAQKEGVALSPSVTYNPRGSRRYKRTKTDQSTPQLQENEASSNQPTQVGDSRQLHESKANDRRSPVVRQIMFDDRTNFDDLPYKVHIGKKDDPDLVQTPQRQTRHTPRRNSDRKLQKAKVSKVLFPLASKNWAANEIGLLENKETRNRRWEKVDTPEASNRKGGGDWEDTLGFDDLIKICMEDEAWNSGDAEQKQRILMEMKNSAMPAIENQNVAHKSATGSQDSDGSKSTPSTPTNRRTKKSYAEVSLVPELTGNRSVSMGSIQRKIPEPEHEHGENLNSIEKDNQTNSKYTSTKLNDLSASPKDKLSPNNLSTERTQRETKPEANDINTATPTTEKILNNSPPPMNGCDQEVLCEESDDNMCDDNMVEKKRNSRKQVFEPTCDTRKKQSPTAKTKTADNSEMEFIPGFYDQEPDDGAVIKISLPSQSEAGEKMNSYESQSMSRTRDLRMTVSPKVSTPLSQRDYDHKIGTQSPVAGQVSAATSCRGLYPTAQQGIIFQTTERTTCQPFFNRPVATTQYLWQQNPIPPLMSQLPYVTNGSRQFVTAALTPATMQPSYSQLVASSMLSGQGVTTPISYPSPRGSTLGASGQKISTAGNSSLMTHYTQILQNSPQNKKLNIGEFVYGTLPSLRMPNR